MKGLNPKNIQGGILHIQWFKESKWKTTAFYKIISISSAPTCDISLSLSKKVLVIVGARSTQWGTKHSNDAFWYKYVRKNSAGLFAYKYRPPQFLIMSIVATFQSRFSDLAVLAFNESVG